MAILDQNTTQDDELQDGVLAGILKAAQTPMPTDPSAGEYNMQLAPLMQEPESQQGQLNVPTQEATLQSAPLPNVPTQEATVQPTFAEQVTPETQSPETTAQPTELQPPVQPVATDAPVSVPNQTPSPNGNQTDPGQAQQTKPEEKDNRTFLDKLAGMFQDPAFINSANAFASSLAGDKASYNQFTNAYSQTMQDRRDKAAQAAREVKQEAARKEQTNYERAMNERETVLQLSQTYTPDSVRRFLDGGGTDPSMLEKKPLTAAELKKEQREDTKFEAEQQKTASEIKKNDASAAESLAKANPASDAMPIGNLPENNRNDIMQGRLTQTPDGQILAPKYYKNQIVGSQPANEAQIKGFSNSVGRNQLSASEQSIASDINDVTRLVDDADTKGAIAGVSPTSSALAEYSPFASAIAGNFANDKTRELNTKTARLNAAAEQIGVAAARSMGITGVNTVEEARRAGIPVPHIDTSSPERYKRSLEEYKEFIKNYSSSTRTPEQQQNVSSQTSGASGQTSGASGQTSGASTSGWAIRKI